MSFQQDMRMNCPLLGERQSNNSYNIIPFVTQLYYYVFPSCHCTISKFIRHIASHALCNCCKLRNVSHMQSIRDFAEVVARDF